LRAKPSPVVQIKEAVQKAQEDKDVAGVIVKVNSPGGTVTAADIMYHELISFKQKRGIPVYACIMGIGTSGGYYVAAAADKIYAHPTSVTGSIGIIALKFNVEGLLGKIGVEEYTYKSADKKDIMSIFRNDTPEEREIIKKVIDSMHQRFIDSVYAQRKSVLSREEIEKLADGRIYTADQARSAKLIDQIGYLEDAIGGMKKSLGIEDARIVAYYRPGEYRDTIYSSYGNPDAQVTNLMERGSEILTPFPDMDFLYLWRP
jgi:protease-4